MFRIGPGPGVGVGVEFAVGAGVGVDQEPGVGTVPPRLRTPVCTCRWIKKITDPFDFPQICHAC